MCRVRPTFADGKAPLVRNEYSRVRPMPDSSTASAGVSQAAGELSACVSLRVPGCSLVSSGLLWCSLVSFSKGDAFL